MVKLLFLGDVSLAGYKRSQLLNGQNIEKLKETLFQYKGTIIANLESPLTKGTLNLNKSNLKADPDLFDLIPKIDIFSLSNNHISDVGEEGAKDTKKTLKNAGKGYFGHGCDIFEARKPLIFQRNGIKFGFLGYSCLTTNGENYATAIKSGVSPIAEDYLREDIVNAKKKAKHVVVMLHWGVENELYPTPDQIALARGAIDCGASLVIGTHPHVIQGIEEYGGGYICYSIGNFMFSNFKYKVRIKRDSVAEKRLIQRQNNLESVGVEFVFDHSGIKMGSKYYFKADENFIPVVQKKSQLKLDIDKISKSLHLYASNSSRIKNIVNLKIGTAFNGRIYQYIYMLKTIDRTKPSIVNRIKRRFNVK